MSLPQTLTQTIRQAEAEIQRHAQRQRAPKVIWQSLNETLDAFDRRITNQRRRLPHYIPLLAVCEPHPTLINGVTLCEMTRPMLELLHPDASARYRVAYSGRGAGKSWCFIRGALVYAVENPLRIMFGRELQTSISESVHKLAADQIVALNLENWFEVQQTSIVGANGSEFIFSGIRNNPTKLKSTEGIDIIFLEEAEKISADSWQIVIPTIRKPGSQIWVGFNPDQATDPTYDRLITHSPPRSIITKTSWRDNPWLSDELAAEREYLWRVDPDAHAWVWEGECRTATDAQVLKNKWVIETFEPNAGWDGPYQGCDFGYVDPTVLARVWVHKKCLYVEHEAFAVNADINQLPALFDHIPLARQYVTRADNARPETINYLKNAGYPKFESVEKGKGSVEDGVAYIRQFEQIVIHPRCKHAAEEARLWSYKVDRLSGDVLPDLKAGNDHVWDAIRYSLQPLIKHTGQWFFGTLGGDFVELGK